MGISQQQHERTIAKVIAAGKIKRPEVLYDLGVGQKSEWKTLSGVYPWLRVAGCEPNPAMAANVRRAGFPGPLYEVAIAGASGRAQLHFIPNAPPMTASLLPGRGTRPIDVACWTLYEFDAHAISDLAFSGDTIVWADIEGMELAALQSGSPLLDSGRVKWINVEERRGNVPCDGWTNPRELRAWLNSRGFVRVCAYNRHPTHQDAIYVLRSAWR